MKYIISQNPTWRRRHLGKRQVNISERDTFEGNLVCS